MTDHISTIHNTTPSNGGGSPAEQPSPTQAVPPVTVHPPQVQPEHRGLLRGALLCAVVAVALLASGFVPKFLRSRTLESAALARKNAPLEVNAFVVRPGKADSPLVLPSNIEPITDAIIYARIDGYVDRRLVDIGDRVQTGQLLAVISSPETDQELHAAEQALEQSKHDLDQANAAIEAAKANLFIADVTNQRWQNLVVRSVVSQEEADTTESSYQARKADLVAAQANQRASLDAVGVNEHRVQRLKQLVSYERVVAPFPGIITQRNIDIGSLVSAGSNANIPVLYHLAKLDRMRIFVDVPQSDSEYVDVGQNCAVQVRELGNREFTATVTRFAQSIDVASRTMRTEVQLPNPTGELLPGMYATVRFDFVRKQAPIIIPADTLVASPKGDQVVVVRHGSAHFQDIRVAADYGSQVELEDGIQEGDTLIENVTDAVQEGTKVKVVVSDQGSGR
jgi:RND family efflux transporter MFP subunit